MKNIKEWNNKIKQNWEEVWFSVCAKEQQRTNGVYCLEAWHCRWGWGCFMGHEVPTRVCCRLNGSVVLLLQQIMYSSCILFDINYLMAIHCHFSDGYTSISQTNLWLTLHDF